MTIPNDTRFVDLEKEVREDGRNAALGKDSLPTFAFRIARAAKDGVIDTAKDKHGGGVDDAKYFYTQYVNAFSKKAIHDHGEDSFKVQVSKTRKILQAASLPTCDFVITMERAAVIHKAMMAAGEKPKPVYACFVDVARAQLEDGQTDVDLTDEQIKGACARKDPKEKTVESVLTSVSNTLEKLITGDKGLVDRSEQVTRAFESIRERLAAMMLQADHDAFLARAAELGYNVNVPQ